MKWLKKETTGFNLLKNVLISILYSVFSSLAYIFAALITGLGGFVTLVVSSLVYGLIQYLCLKKSNTFGLIVKLFAIIFINTSVMYLIWHYKLFRILFIRVYDDQPSPGTGFGLLLSFIINIVIFLIIYVYTFLSNKKH